MKDMTEQDFAEGFQEFLRPGIAAALASALCQKQETVQVIDDSDDCIGYEDGASFDENGQYLPGTGASAGEKATNMALTERPWLISLPTETFWSSWMHGAVRDITGKDALALFGADPDDLAVRSTAEIAVAVCAIRKAFPADASELIRAYVKENPVYSLFWNQALPRVACLLPDNVS